jgi:glycosyltransferase involved in cell wall biosynthesis
VGDSKILANFLDSILDMPEKEKETIAENAFDSVRSNYSIEKMCDRTLKLYQEYLKK